MTALAQPAAPPRPTRPRLEADRLPALRRTGPRLLLPPSPDPAPSRSHDGSTTQPFQLRSVLSPLTESAWPVAIGSQPVTTPPLPDPTQLCGAVVLAAVEALRSTRPLVQLARWVSPGVYEALARSAQPAVGHEARRRAAVRGLRVCRISATVAEGSAVIQDGNRVRAAAVRLEVHRGSWRATALQIG